MDIKTIVINKRRNIGDYEHIDISISTEIGMGDDPQECIDNVLALIDSKLPPRNFNLLDEDEKEEYLSATAPKKKAKAKGPAAKKAAAPKSKFTKKATLLDPAQEMSKKWFGEVMDTVVPRWRKSPVLQKKAGKIMRKLAGEAIVDGEGNVMEEFVDLVRAEFR